MDKLHHSTVPSPGYETSDANSGKIVRALVVLAILLIGSGLVCWAMFHFFVRQQSRLESPSPFSETRQVPSGPQLQVYPREDWQKFHQEQVDSLNAAGWENRGAGTVRIPIDQAMDLLVKKGIPVAGETAPNAPAKAAATKAPAVGEKKR